MKKNNLITIILYFIIIITMIGGFIFSYFEKINNKEVLEKIPVETSPNPAFNPASLDWKEVISSAQWEKRDSQATIVYKDKIWVMGGVDANGHVISQGNVDYGKAKYLSDVWSSEDGKNWQLVLNKAPFGDRRSIEVVDFKGKMWLMGGWGPKVGYKNDVWSSADGINWKLETSSAGWPAREGHQLVVFQNKIWFIGGVKYGEHHILPWFFGGITLGKNQLFNDVWYSDDGINWKEATKNAGWAPRWDDAVSVFNNKLWMIDGMDYYGNLYKDVWSSTDGITWSLVDKDPPFASRQGNAIIDYQNKLWVISRLNSSEYGGGANDVWYSDDGINWEKTKQDPLWTGREDVGVVVFKDKIWVMGGMDKNFTWTNDVWQSTSNIDAKK
ncbi:MAG: hypothetical protein NT094_00650 [Candidatus Staskawiczbacteria bacterium]|nr:hypothetical protein [Candidatus Staskawiczbacteria bacterium]